MLTRYLSRLITLLLYLNKNYFNKEENQSINAIYAYLQMGSTMIKLFLINKR